MLKTILVDTELSERQYLEQLIAKVCPRIEVISTVSNGSMAKNVIEALQPDLVFLEIEMPFLSGFKIVDHYAERNIDFVTMTRKEEHALSAFKHDVAGFLLKPIGAEALSKVVNKIIERKKKQEGFVETETSPPIQRKIFPSPNGLIYLNPDEIIYLQAEGRNTHIYLKDGKSILCNLSIKACLESIQLPIFVRVHRSYVINLTYIQHYTKGRDSFVLMENKARIDVGKNYKDGLSEIVSYFIR